MKFFKGAFTFQGVLKARIVDSVNSSVMATYPFKGTETVEILFPGDSASVVLSTLNAGEVTPILSGGNWTGDFSFKMLPAKTALLKAGTKQSVNFNITDGTDTFPAQADKVLDVVIPANT
jgi:hypothetical protein